MLNKYGNSNTNATNSINLNAWNYSVPMQKNKQIDKLEHQVHRQYTEEQVSFQFV